MSRRIARYLLLDEIQTPTHDPAVSFWRGHDEILDREVSVRLLHADDERANAFLGAARAAALVDDRRLLRILDILEIPASDDGPAAIAVVSEWARGHNLVEGLAARAGDAMPVERAVAIIDDVARAVAAGLATKVAHGRLRPSSVIVTDAGEVRVRGLAVDAALWGQLDPRLTKEQADVDGLGSLLYLLVTGTWPTASCFTPLPPAPRNGSTVLPPSHLRADVPRHVDDCIARSVHAAARPRGVRNVADAAGFAAMLGVTRDHVAPAADGEVSAPMRVVGRLLAALAAVAVAVGVGTLGWQLVVGGPKAWSDTKSGADTLLTTPTVQTITDTGIERVLPVAAVRSFDPRGDDDHNGKADNRKGRENDDRAPNAIDADKATAWTSAKYATPDLDGKGGVGLVVDLGATQSVRAVSLDFVGAGAPVEVRVADRIYPDPGTWNLLTTAGAGGGHIDLRGARPINGRYVLIWFPQVPPSATADGRYQVQVGEVTIRG